MISCIPTSRFGDTCLVLPPSIFDISIYIYVCVCVLSARRCQPISCGWHVSRDGRPASSQSRIACFLFNQKAATLSLGGNRPELHVVLLQ